MYSSTAELPVWSESDRCNCAPTPLGSFRVTIWNGSDCSAVTASATLAKLSRVLPPQRYGHVPPLGVGLAIFRFVEKQNVCDEPLLVRPVRSADIVARRDDAAVSGGPFRRIRSRRAITLHTAREVPQVCMHVLLPVHRAPCDDRAVLRDVKSARTAAGCRRWLSAQRRARQAPQARRSGKDGGASLLSSERNFVNTSSFRQLASYFHECRNRRKQHRAARGLEILHRNCRTVPAEGAGKNFLTERRACPISPGATGGSGNFSRQNQRQIWQNRRSLVGEEGLQPSKA